jgi:hypothetical protein
MKLITNTIILFLLAFNFGVYAQDSKGTASAAFPYSIFSIDCKEINRDYALNYMTQLPDDFIVYGRNFYAVDLNLTLKDDAVVPDSSIGVIIQSWTGDEERYILNPNNFVAKSKYYYHYEFEFRAHRSGMAVCRLVWYNKSNNTYIPVSGHNKSISENFFLP